MRSDDFRPLGAYGVVGSYRMRRLLVLWQMNLKSVTVGCVVESQNAGFRLLGPR